MNIDIYIGIINYGYFEQHNDGTNVLNGFSLILQQKKINFISLLNTKSVNILTYLFYESNVIIENNCAFKRQLNCYSQKKIYIILAQKKCK